MNTKIILVTLGFVLALAPRHLAAQSSSMTLQDFHDRLVAIITRRAPAMMPAGDTSVTWNRTPILYHIVHTTAHSLQSGFLRNDSLVGLAEATWGADGVRSFHVTWTAANTEVLALQAVISGSHIYLSGSRTDTLQAPTLPWAIADFGMDEHLVPLLLGLTPSPDIQRVVVYRPFGGKWDSLDVVVASGAEGSTRVLQITPKDTVRWVIAKGGVLLQLMTGGVPVERRPLEESAWYAAYRRLRFMPPDVK
jgi:hypothetical protein